MSDTSFSVAKFLSSKKSMLQSLFDKFTSKGEQENSVGYVEIIFYMGGGVLVYCVLLEILQYCVLCIVGKASMKVLCIGLKSY